MRIGVSSPLFCWTPFDEMLRSIEEEFELWEVVCDGKHYLPDFRTDARDLLSTTDIALSLHAPLSDINIGAIHRGVRKASVEAIKATISTAQFLDIDLVTMHPGHLSPTSLFAQDRARSIIIDSTEEIAHFAGDHDVTVAVENMPPFKFTIMTTPEELQAVFDETGLGFCLDIGHANTAGNLEGFLAMAPDMRNVHIHDNKGQGDPHLPIGDGDIDFKRFLPRLLEGYDGDLVIESNNLEEGVVSRNRLDALVE